MIWCIAGIWMASGVFIAHLFSGVERERKERDDMRDRLLGKLIDAHIREEPVSCPACVAVAVLIAREHCLEWPMGRAIIARRIQEGRCEPHTHLETV